MIIQRLKATYAVYEVHFSLREINRENFFSK